MCSVLARVPLDVRDLVDGEAQGGIHRWIWPVDLRRILGPINVAAAVW